MISLLRSSCRMSWPGRTYPAAPRRDKSGRRCKRQRRSSRSRRYIMQARKALLPDVPQIYSLISSYVPDGTLLPRSEKELYENICDFTVVEEEGEILACGALHFYGMHL